MERIDDLLIQVIAEAKALLIPISNKISPFVLINKRAKTRLGCCVHKNGEFSIQLSVFLLDEPEKLIKETLAHEILHSCKGCQNHQILWKSYAQKMNDAYGYNITTTKKSEFIPSFPKREVKYQLQCQSCGANFSRNRMSKLVKSPSRYLCKCGGKIARIN